MTSDEMKLVLEAVTQCSDYIEATPIMARLASSFPEHRDAIDAAFDEFYGFDTVDDGRFTLSLWMGKNK